MAASVIIRVFVKDLDEYLKLDPDSPSGIRARALRDRAQRTIVESQDTSALELPQP